MFSPTTFSLFVSFGKHDCFCCAVVGLLDRSIIHNHSYRLTIMRTTCFASQWRNYRGYTKQEDTTIHSTGKSFCACLKPGWYIWGGEWAAGTRPRHHPIWRYLTFCQKLKQRSQVLMSSKLFFGFNSVEHLSFCISFSASLWRLCPFHRLGDHFSAVSVNNPLASKDDLRH